MVSVRSQLRDAVCTTASVRRSVIGRKETEDVGECHLIPVYLTVLLLLVDTLHVFVAPGVAGDLVSFGYHPPERIRLTSARVVDGTLGTVHTGDEEGHGNSVSAKEVKKIVSVVVWTVIKRESHGAGGSAGGNVDAVWNMAKLMSRRRGSVRSVGHDVSVAGWAVGELAAWSRAVCSPSSANTLPTKVSKSIDEGSGGGRTC